MEGGLNFPSDFVRPFFWHVAIAADCPDTRTVVVMNGLLVFLVYIVFHDVARNTKILSIRNIHCGIKCAPEYDASDEHRLDSQDR